MRVHESLVRRLHGDTEVRSVVDMSVEIEVNGIDTVLDLLKRRTIRRETAFLVGLGGHLRQDRYLRLERCHGRETMRLGIQ